MSALGVSVVIATRDRIELLERAIAAVLSQSYKGPIEIIVVFDRSEPIGRLAMDDEQRRVRVMTNTRTAGLPGARNTGILAASHDLVAFCDDDDTWLPEKLTAQVNALDADTGLLAAVTGVQIRYDGSTHSRILDRSMIGFDDLIRSRLTEAHPSTFLIRRSALVGDVGLVDEEIPGGYGEDYDLLLRIARHSPIAVVQRPLVEVLWHTGSFFTRKFETIVTALDYMLDKHPEFARDARGLARVQGQQAFALAACRRPRESLAKARSTLRRNPRELRALASLLINARLLSPEQVLSLAHRTGRGI